jgi:hypothetical protein
MPIDQQFSAVYPKPQKHEPVITPGVAVLAGAVEALAVSSCVPTAFDANGLPEGVFHELGASSPGDQHGHSSKLG